MIDMCTVYTVTSQQKQIFYLNKIFILKIEIMFFVVIFVLKDQNLIRNIFILIFFHIAI